MAKHRQGLRRGVKSGQYGLNGVLKMIKNGVSENGVVHAMGLLLRFLAHQCTPMHANAHHFVLVRINALHSTSPAHQPCTSNAQHFGNRRASLEVALFAGP
jgi:hypothetical protein